ncbi:MAG TPA: hypothetical protein VHE30_11245 [Polyangiaceae bacterium]|nr:hypothetical protein [Polyangiaceae bacterium]
MKQSTLGLFGLFASLLMPGCMLFGGVRVEPVATSVQKPSNVAVYMAVSQGQEPALGLSEQSFQVSEDGQPLTAEQSRQVLLPRDMVAVHRALLLVDMSGPIAEGDTRKTIAMAVARFVTKAHQTQPVSVFAFDGGAQIRSIGEFPEGNDEIAEIPALESYTSQDTSSNLNGAVIEAIAQLDARLMTAQKPIRVGTLVVFARGPDLAGRVTEGKMREALSDSKDLVLAISSKDAPGFRASSIEKDGAFEAESMASILDPFDRAGERAASLVNRYYLLSYCSPARAGKRRFKIVVTTKNDEDKEIQGSMSGEFDADGFGSGCDPTTRPRFVQTARPDEDEQKDKEKSDRPAKGSSKSAKPPAENAAAPADEDAVAPPPDKPGYAK